MRLITLVSLLGTYPLLLLAGVLELSIYPRDPEAELFPSDYAVMTPRPGNKRFDVDTSPFAVIAAVVSGSSTDDNGPALETPPADRRAFSSLTRVYEKRQGCSLGYGSCSEDPGTCCPYLGDCCGEGKCCGTGDWCYGPGCCSLTEGGCDQQVRSLH